MEEFSAPGPFLRIRRTFPSCNDYANTTSIKLRNRPKPHFWQNPPPIPCSSPMSIIFPARLGTDRDVDSAPKWLGAIGGKVSAGHRVISLLARPKFFIRSDGRWMSAASLSKERWRNVTRRLGVTMKYWRWWRSRSLPLRSRHLFSRCSFPNTDARSRESKRSGRATLRHRFPHWLWSFIIQLWIFTFSCYSSLLVSSRFIALCRGLMFSSSAQRTRGCLGS